MRSVLLLMLSMVAVGVAAERSVSASDAPGRIVEVVGESGDAGPSPRLVVMDADGKHVRHRLDWVMGASLDPSARLVAYTLRTIPSEIWVVAVDGRGRGRRVVANGYDPDWSPDGAAIAFSRVQPRRAYGIWTADRHGGNQRLVARSGSSPDWSPDGRKLAFDRGSDIWVVELPSKSAHRVIRNGLAPRWSPDGRRIAFARYSSAGSIFVANADGSGQRRIADGESPIWSPGGGELAACVFDRIVRMRADGTRRRVVYRGAPACQSLDWRG